MRLCVQSTGGKTNEVLPGYILVPGLNYVSFAETRLYLPFCVEPPASLCDTSDYSTWHDPESAHVMLRAEGQSPPSRHDPVFHHSLYVTETVRGLFRFQREAELYAYSREYGLLWEPIRESRIQVRCMVC